MDDETKGSAVGRSRAPVERQRDAERTRQRLLAAALDEFAAKGFARARLQDIADGANVNKQLIAYYFGGKDGLYRAIQREWLERESTFSDPDAPLDSIVDRYALDALSDPRPMRLLVWRGLADDREPTPDEAPERIDLSSLRQRQERGELAQELDPGAVLLAIIGMVAAPVIMPMMAHKISGLDPAAPEFADMYRTQLRSIIRALAASPPAPESPDKP